MRKPRYSLLLLLTTFLFAITACDEKIKTDEENESENGNENVPEVVEPVLDKSKIHLTPREMRGVWFTTVYNIDWPSYASSGDPDIQKYEMQQYFNLFEELNINTIFFQIRGMADSFYESKYEPWSRVFTGEIGKNPGWDPIGFAIEEAHKRGMDIHAWMNPYRIAKRKNASESFPELDPRIPAEWTRDYETVRMYNPALPEVRQRLADIVTEVLTKYPELDGIHFDDYFYPDGVTSDELKDKEEYEKYRSEGQGIIQWRMENVNKMVQKIQKTVKEIDPEIAFTISPAGNMGYNLDVMYADVEKWCKEAWIDAVIPQLYWSRAYFDPRLEEFCGLSHDVPVIVGYGTYNYDSGVFTDPNLFAEEYAYASGFKKVIGSVHYNARALDHNNHGITDVVKKVYEIPGLAPYFGPEREKPASPTNAKIRFGKLTWEGEGVQFAIYKDNGTGATKYRSAKLIGVTTKKEFKLTEKGSYYITAIDSHKTESLISDEIVL